MREKNRARLDSFALESVRGSLTLNGVNVGRKHLQMSQVFYYFHYLQQTETLKS